MPTLKLSLIVLHFGAFIALPGGYHEGMVNISRISREKVQNIGGILAEGDIVKVKRYRN
jgi:predicted RNA-binding protein with RPS1 domain